jgi:hypothetical protein
VARIDLPSGAWVEYRDTLTAGDMFAVQESIVFDSDGGKITYHGGLQNQMRNALLTRIITAWSFEDKGIPIPSRHVARASVFTDMDMSIDDYNTLAAAVEPLVTKVRWQAPNPQPSQT